MGEAGARRYREAVRAALIGALTLGAAACDKQEDRRERAAKDARDIAQVEAAQDQHPPIEPVYPQPILFADRQAFSLNGGTCGLVPGAPPAGDPVVVTGPKRAVLKLDGRLVLLASDSGSAGLPLGTWTHYVGKERSLTLEKGAGDGASPGSDRLRWPGKLTVRDRWDRVIYVAEGSLECGA